MNTPIRWMQNYLLGALPLVLGNYIWMAVDGNLPGSVDSSVFLRGLWNVLVSVSFFWMLILFVFVTVLAVSKAQREHFIRELAGVEERDERESYFVGQAATRAMLSTLALGIFIFFLSLFTFSLQNLKPEARKDGATKSFSIELDLNPVDVRSLHTADSNTIIRNQDIPFKKSAIILLVLVWQIGAFRIYSRKIANEI